VLVRLNEPSQLLAPMKMTLEQTLLLGSRDVPSNEDSSERLPRSSTTCCRRNLDDRAKGSGSHVSQRTVAVPHRRPAEALASHHTAGASSACARRRCALTRAWRTSRYQGPPHHSTSVFAARIVLSCAAVDVSAPSAARQEMASGEVGLTVHRGP
jgi:hypothetical protein